MKLTALMVRCHTRGLQLLVPRSSLSLKKRVAGFTTTGLSYFRTEIGFSSNYHVVMTLFSSLVLLHFVTESTKPKVAWFHQSSPPAPRLWALLSRGGPLAGAGEPDKVTQLYW